MARKFREILPNLAERNRTREPRVEIVSGRVSIVLPKVADAEDKTVQRLSSLAGCAAVGRTGRILEAIVFS